MRPRIDPERFLPAAALCLGLSIGGGFFFTGAAPGCAAEQCTVPGGSELPVSVLDCPTGTLCYQGSCLPACASGAENNEKCESDSDCSSPARPNCVDRRCSSCEEGQRCVPALNICSSVRPNSVDGGTVIGDAGFVPGVTPLDGGAIDGSVLNFDSGEPPVAPVRPVTHVARLELGQRADLRNNQVITSSIVVEVLDIRGTGRVIGSTVAPFLVGTDEEVCQVVRRDTYSIQPPLRVDMGEVQFEPGVDSPGLVLAYVASFGGGRYVPQPAPQPSSLIHTTAGGATFARVHGAGLMGINGAWPPGTDQDLVVVPERFEPDPPTLALLRAGIDLRVTPTFEVVWNRAALGLTGSAVVLRVENDRCVLTCTSPSRETNSKMRFPESFGDVFRAAPCNGAGVQTLYVERVSARRLNAASDETTGALVDLSVRIRDGFTARIVF